MCKTNNRNVYVSTVFNCMLSGLGVAGLKFRMFGSNYSCCDLIFIFRLIVHTRLLETSSFIFKCTVWLKSNSYFPYSGTVLLWFKISFSLIHA